MAIEIVSVPMNQLQFAVVTLIFTRGWTYTHTDIYIYIYTYIYIYMGKL